MVLASNIPKRRLVFQHLVLGMNKSFPFKLGSTRDRNSLKNIINWKDVQVCKPTVLRGSCKSTGDALPLDTAERALFPFDVTRMNLLLQAFMLPRILLICSLVLLIF